MSTTESATIRALGPKTTEIKIRDFTLIQDKPAEFGGNDRGPMASEYFLAAWGACMMTTFTRVAQIRKVPIDDARVEARIILDDKGMTESLELDAHVTSSAPEKAVKTAFELAAKSCTVSRLIGDIPVQKRVLYYPSK